MWEDETCDLKKAKKCNQNNRDEIELFFVWIDSNEYKIQIKMKGQKKSTAIWMNLWALRFMQHVSFKTTTIANTTDFNGDLEDSKRKK